MVDHDSSSHDHWHSRAVAVSDPPRSETPSKAIAAMDTPVTSNASENVDSAESLLSRFEFLYGITKGDPTSERMKQRMSKFSPTDLSTHRFQVIAALSGEIYEDPAAPPLVALRFNNASPATSVIEDTDGRKFPIIDPELGKGGQGSVLLVEDSSYPIADGRHDQVLKVCPITVMKEKKNKRWIAAESDPRSDVARTSREAMIAEELSKEDSLKYMAPKFLGRVTRKTVTATGEETFNASIQYEFARSMSAKQLRDGMGEHTMPLRAFYDLALQMLISTHAFHWAKFIHRDIKLGNFVIRSDGKGTMIIDYGYAKRKGDDEGDEDMTVLTQAGVLMGTPAYMSPEQFDSPASVDEKADVYSLAVTLNQLLTGRLVFKCANATAYRLAHLNEPPTEAIDHLKTLGLPEEIVTSLEQALAKDPEQRPTVEDLMRIFVKYSSFDTKLKPRDMLERTRRGLMKLKLPEELLQQVSKPDAPLPSGFPSSPNDRDDKGAESMYFALKAAYPMQVVASTRRGIGRALWPVVALTGIVAAMTGNSMLRKNSVKESSVPTVTPIGVDVPSSPVTTVSQESVTGRENVQESPQQPSSQEIFHSSDLFEGTVEKGKLTKLVLFKGKTCEMTVDAAKILTFTSGGKVSMVKVDMSLEMLEKYTGLSREELLRQKPKLNGMTSVPAFLIVNGQGFVFTINYTGWVSGAGDQASVHTDLSDSAIHTQYGEHVALSKQESDYRNDPRMLSVLDSLPETQEFESLDDYKKACLGVILSWKNECKNAQQK
ncbi:serine/threonine protein kinase [Candidatus Peribacteria bacterium]|nr:serine/threonine protein kinase [Candidatus Peribacteria bacterium]